MIKLFEVMSVNTIYCKLGQTWANLSGTDPEIAFFRGRGEYGTIWSESAMLLSMCIKEGKSFLLYVFTDDIKCHRFILTSTPSLAQI
jgi:hypothetical protein